MKDAYSYHTSQEDMDFYYEKALRAYDRIFKRCGLPEVIAVLADSGMMGGKISHEFMQLSPVGEDSIVICRACDYRANMEAAENIIVNDTADAPQAMKKVHTPNAKTIEEVCTFLDLPLEKACKAVIYQKAVTGEYLVLFIRGDLEANETKITNHIKSKIVPAVITENCGLVAGFLGPKAFPGVTLLFDSSLKGLNNLCCGANETDHHCTGFQIERDFGTVAYHDFSKALENGICPKCNAHALSISRGIEVGNIFQLSDRYTKAMEMKYADADGALHYPLMGCYGIGVGRLAASVCEAYHDDYGPVWPMAIAPWQVHLCCLRVDDTEVKAFADGLYEQLKANKIEVIYDDRKVNPGFMFSDADLLGVPLRVVVSPRNMKEGCCEIMTRNKVINEKVACDEIISRVIKYIF
jgi:prolyl-tRNA synthetase